MRSRSSSDIRGSSGLVRSDQDFAAGHRLPVSLDCPGGILQSHPRANVSAELAIQEPWDAPLEQDQLGKRLPGQPCWDVKPLDGLVAEDNIWLRDHHRLLR